MVAVRASHQFVRRCWFLIGLIHCYEEINYLSNPLCSQISVVPLRAGDCVLEIDGSIYLAIKRVFLAEILVDGEQNSFLTDDELKDSGRQVVCAVVEAAVSIIAHTIQI